MTINSTMTAGEVSTLALQMLGVYGAGEDVTAEDTALACQQLNWMLKSWQARGLTSWRDTEQTLTFPAGTATVALNPYGIDVTHVRLAYDGFERPLTRWELGRYRDLPVKTVQGIPTCYVVQRADAATTVTLWPVPNANMTVTAAYVRVIEDINDPSDTIDVPQEWLETVTIALAARLAATFGTTRVDTATAGAITQRAAAFEQLLFDSDRPASIYFMATPR